MMLVWQFEEIPQEGIPTSSAAEEKAFDVRSVTPSEDSLLCGTSDNSSSIFHPHLLGIILVVMVIMIIVLISTNGDIMNTNNSNK